jgi:hypothetical protein
MVGRAVNADFASSAENNGTAMKKAADRLVRRVVRLGQHSIIAAVILSIRRAPKEYGQQF